VRLRRSDGAYRWHLVRSVPFSDATGHAGKWIVTATDIEERKAAEKTLASTIAELEHIAHHDPMTDLPNRMRLMERVQHAIAHAQQIHGGVAVLYIDLDRFKAVNDSLGHAAGDEVLRQTGRRILASLRDGDIASRVGGDEFVVVCGTTRSNDDGSRVAARILAAVTEPIVVAGERVAVEACIGVSVFPADGNDADSLIRCADTAMYAAKQSGRNTYRRFNNEAHADALAAAAFEAELRHALSAEQLVVYYQPIIDLNTMRPHAAEALVRWHHPQRGLLAPGEFIAFAEERGLIAQIGAFVMEQACAMLGRLPQMGAGELRIGINVSAHEFSRDSFIPAIMAVLKRYSLDARQLTVEITESVMMGDTRATMATLDQLRKLGVYLSVDDFGTGYSSLAYIKRFPISTLKIDRSFVRDIAEDKTDQAIAKTIITLAHSLGMRVVAEGVETQAQLEQLESFEVDSVQGFLFSRPLAPADFEDYVKMWYSDRSPGCEAKPLLSPEL
jgi:diguanylate cyclase (GGDEF)-like protein